MINLDYKIKQSDMFKYILGCICCLTFFACNSEDNETESADTVILQINLNSRAAIPDVNLMSDCEYLMKRVRILAFDGNTLDVNYFDDNITSNNLGAYTALLKVKTNPQKQLYAVINEPSNATAYLNGIQTLNELKSQSWQQYTLNTGYNALKLYTDAASFTNFTLPMYGEANVNATSSSATTPINIGMTVNRAVARVDLFFKNDDNLSSAIFNKDTRILVNNYALWGYILPDFIYAETTLDDLDLTNPEDNWFLGNLPSTMNETIPTNSYKRIISFYVPEMECTNEKLGFKIFNLQYGSAANSFNYFELNVNKIERNTLYRITCTLKAQNLPIEFKASVAPWKEAEDINIDM